MSRIYGRISITSNAWQATTSFCQSAFKGWETLEGRAGDSGGSAGYDCLNSGGGPDSLIIGLAPGSSLAND